MGDVRTLTPRPKPAVPAMPDPLTGAAFRASLEEAAQIATMHWTGSSQRALWPRPTPRRSSATCLTSRDPQAYSG
jgi:hypothetical protein